MHKVICPYCRITFDRDKIECVQVGRRYAHPGCFKEAESQKSQEEKDKQSLEDYIKQLLGINSITPKIRKQIETYVKDNGFTYSGIKKALIYFYEIKKGDISKANGGIGIVPYTYDESYRYYYAIWEANQRNEAKIKMVNRRNDINKITFNIPIPEAKIKTRKLFTFLDEEKSE